jgi:hypothetical protein
MDIPSTPWKVLTEEAPPVGAWVLMYLRRYGGVDRYRAGLYMGPNDWMSAANWAEPHALLRDADVTHWQLLPRPPGEASSSPSVAP